MKKSIIAKKNMLLDELLDDRINMYGIYNTICYLLDFGFTTEELIAMDFDEADIIHTIETQEI